MSAAGDSRLGALEQVRVVLVEPSHPGNVGAAARAMKNMGLADLALVRPEDYPSPEAIARASGADDLLNRAKVVDELEHALEGIGLVIGTSARARRLPWPLKTAREACGDAIEALARGRVAIVFGRENAGLTNAELERCHLHLNIPTDASFSSLNLGAAVQVVCYELRMAAVAAAERSEEDGADGRHSPRDPLAPAEELERFYAHLEEALIAIGFLEPQHPNHDKLLRRLKRLYNRARPDVREMRILRGICAKTVVAAAAGRAMVGRPTQALDGGTVVRDDVMDLDMRTRKRLAQAACVAAWSDTDIAQQEREIVMDLCRILDLSERDTKEVQGWLQHGPPDLDPFDIRTEHRTIFLDVVNSVFAADGRIDPMESETLRLLKELLS